MGSRLRPFVLATLALGEIGLVACSLVYPTDGFSGGVDAASDTPGDTQTVPSDGDGGPPPRDGGDARPPDPLPRLNIFPAGTFESDEECGPMSWSITAASVRRVAGGHESPSACRICSTQARVTTAFDYFPLFNPPLTRGETYQTRIWVRALGTPQTIESRVRVYDGDDFVEASSSGDQSIGTAWTEIVVTHTVNGESRRLNPVFFSYPQASGECYLIDDVAVYKLD